MEDIRIKSSKRVSDRPKSQMRPVTSMRPMTTTGLEAPKTSRGKTAGLQRQVQDKSYWVGVLKTKINELTAEITTISRENEEMALEENRMGLLKKKAETLAKELAANNSQLSVYSEFMDRQRVGDTIDDMKEDVEAMKMENEELASSLESGFEDQKRLEGLISGMQKRMDDAQAAWNRVLVQFDGQQNKELEILERESADLMRDVRSLESEMESLQVKKQQAESRVGMGADSFLRKEILQSIDRLRNLEKQRDDLTDTMDASDEKGRLLGQIKRDNREIASMESRVAELESEVEDVRTELDAYEDTEGAEKYRELKKKEQVMDSFLREFEQTKEQEVSRIRETGSHVNDSLDRITSMICHIDGLKAASAARGTTGSGIERLMDEKRRLELDVSKIAQLENKIKSEQESLTKKIKSLEADVEKYSDIDGLQKEMEGKSASLESERSELRERTKDVKRRIEREEESVTSLRQSLQKNPLFVKTKSLESRLTSVLSTNERINSAISDIDDSFLKKRVLDQMRMYNQRLQGFAAGIM